MVPELQPLFVSSEEGTTIPGNLWELFQGHIDCEMNIQFPLHCLT